MTPPSHDLPLALTMGEPAGIGGEISLQAWHSLQATGPRFFVIDDCERLGSIARTHGWAVPVRAIDTPDHAADTFGEALPVFHRPLPACDTPGAPSPELAGCVIEAIATAVALVRAGAAAAVVSNPVQKSALYAAGFDFPGHTEFLAHLAGTGFKPVMMLACPELRTIPVTVHHSLSQAIEVLSVDSIVHAGVVTAEALRRDFGVPAPRLAIAGLNPHAGEDGALGSEERTTTAVAALQSAGINAFGPVPADTLFHAGARTGYDAALCMYHDQALIPIKTIDFSGAVNVTLGLPFVRTSPDHGTALDIAGRGIADPSSLIAALRLAADMASRRAQSPGPDQG